MNPELLALAARQGDVFSADQAKRYGCGPREIRRLRHDGVLTSVRQSIYCLTPLLESDPVVRHRVHCAAALLARGNPMVQGLPALVVGSLSAAVLWRLIVPHSLRNAERGHGVTTIRGPGSGRTRWVPRAVHLIRGDCVQRTYRAGVHVSPATLTADDIAIRHGIPLTSLARTAVDLCRHTTLWRDAVIVADSALRRGLDKATLQNAAARAANWPGGSMAVRAAAFADGRSESPAESVARALFADTPALTGYDLQVWIADQGEPFARVDFLFRAHRTIVEVDGRVKYDAPWESPQLCCGTRSSVKTGCGTPATRSCGSPGTS